MKTIIKSLIYLAFLIGLNAFGQSYSWSYPISTYNQNSVYSGTLTSSDYNWYEKLQIKNYFLNLYNGISYEAEATLQYNCHFFAWFKTEQYSAYRYWVNYPKKNWLDYSFVKVSSESYPGKVTYSYSNDTLDHSAVTTSTAGRYRSKWGSACVFIHDYDECPYWEEGAQTRKYYSKLEVLGPLELYCETGNYSIPNTTGEGYTVTWSTNENLAIDTYSNYYVNIDPIDDGEGILVAGINKSGYFSTYYRYKYLDAHASPPAMPTSIIHQELCANSEIDFWVEDNNNPNTSITYDWIVDGSGEIINGQGFSRITVATGDIGSLHVYVNRITNCGESLYLDDDYYLSYCSSMAAPLFTLSPNPAAENLKIESLIELPDKLEVDIYNSLMIKVMSTKFSGKEQTIDISRLSKGAYFISVKLNGKTHIQKFIKE